MKKDKTKVLTFNIVFTLPDNFEGDENDALEEVLRYRRSKPNQIDQNPQNLDLEKINIWDEWWELPDNQKIVATYSLGQYDLTNNTFKNLLGQKPE